jgi:hypothetical protein
MKKLFILLVLIPFMSFAKFYKGTVTMNDNSLKKGFIELPEYPDDAKLKFRAEERGSTEKLEIDSVKGFEIINSENETINFVTLYTAYKGKGDYIKIDKKKSWLRILKEGKISLYNASGASSSVISPSGGSMPGSSSGGAIYYIRKGTENYVFIIDQVFGGFTACGNCFSQMKKTLSRIFEKDCPKLADLIVKDDIKKNGYVRIVELYEENCGK